MNEIDFNKGDHILIGKIKMSYEEFYDGYKTDANSGRYNVSSVFYGVIDKYPPTCRKIETLISDGEVSYNLLDVDVAIWSKDLQNSNMAQAVWDRVYHKNEITTLEELQNSGIYKVLFIKEDGSFSKRILIDERLENGLVDLNDEIYIGRQFYKFFSYTYATFIETKADIKSYSEFQEYYGKYIYAITLEHSGKCLGLTWLDFIMHRPDAHLELGATASLAGERFKEFNTFKKGDELKITIMADGYKDVVLTLNFKKNPAHAWANMWYKKGVKRRQEDEK